MRVTDWRRRLDVTGPDASRHETAKGKTSPACAKRTAEREMPACGGAAALVGGEEAAHVQQMQQQQHLRCALREVCQSA